MYKVKNWNKEWTSLIRMAFALVISNMQNVSEHAQSNNIYHQFTNN